MKDANGKEIDIDIFNYTNGLNWRPQPFECIITPRNERIKETILREGQQALSELEQYNGKTKYFPFFVTFVDGRYTMFEFYAKMAKGEKIDW